MPIKSLESYLFERKLANTSSIEILKNATIGIDVEHYLSRIYTFKKEQFLPGIGGVPSSLKNYIKSDLEVFEEFNIKPIFVISGLDIQLQANNYKTNELSPQEQHHESSWAHLGNKQAYNYNNPVESFRLFTDPLPLRPMVHDLIKYFIEMGIEYLVSPYDASFQLSYLYQSGIIDTIYGSTDLLLTKIDKFILGMEFQSKDFRFIDKHKVLSELGLTERQFLDLSIMVGCTIQPNTFPNFPPLPKPNPVQPYPQLSYFKLGLDIIYQYNSFNGTKFNDLYGYIISLNDPNLLDLYYKGHAAIKFLPILNKDGYVALYNVEMAKLGIESNSEFLPNSEDAGTPPSSKSSSKSDKVVKVPTDIHDIISQKLPPELYFYQSIGLLPTGLLEAITRGHLDVRPPLEIGISESYRKLITSKFYVNNLDQQCNLLTQLLARYYQVKKVSVKYWYRDSITEVNNRLTPPIFKRVDKLFIQSDTAKDSFDLTKFFRTLYTKGAEGKYTTTKVISKNEDIVATVLLRTLYLLEIIDEKNHDLKPVGRVLKLLVLESKNITQDELTQFTLLLLLINSKTFKLTDPHREFGSVSASSKSINITTEDLSLEENQFISLISRVFSLHKFNIAPINYQGPISRNLLNFRSHLEFINNSVINTIQTLLVDFIVHQENNDLKTLLNSKDDWYKLIDQLPFYKDLNNTLMGVVSEIYFEVAAKHSKLGKPQADVVSATKEHLLSGVFQVHSPLFNINVHGSNSVSSEQLLGDFALGVLLWKKFVQFAGIANREGLIEDAYLGVIKSADEWLQKLV